MADLKAMRKLLPRADYKLIKNRKCARLSRSRRKEQTTELILANKRLMLENAQLRQQLGLPPVDNIDMSQESSDDEEDSGGAETCQEADDRIQNASIIPAN